MIGSEEDIDQLANRDRIGVVCQTTHRIRDARQLLEVIRERFPEMEVQFVDTVCKPTKDRQSAVEELADELVLNQGLMIVVGGYNSSNTRKLLEVCQEKSVPAHHSENEDQLESDWFQGFGHVGITAGTSTPHEVVDAVHRRIEAFSSQ